MRQRFSGFTLFELIIVMGILAILAGATVSAINPARQFAQARNTQRMGDVQALASAIGMRIADGYGVFSFGTCATAIPEEKVDITFASFASCLVPEYLPALPVDPSATTTSSTGYTVRLDSRSGRVTVCAPQAAEPSLPNSSPYCVTR